MLIKQYSLLLGTSLFTVASAIADETIRVSNDPSGAAGSSHSNFPTVSADGNVVAFLSNADDLVPGDHNGMVDVFVFDRAASRMERVSVDSAGIEADGPTYGVPVLSADGRFVAFSSWATNLDDDPNGPYDDVFLHDRTLKTTRLVSMDPDGLGADGPSYSPSISSDGNRIAFVSGATNLDSSVRTAYYNIYLFDATDSSIRQVNDAPDFEDVYDFHSPKLSGDGMHLIYGSYEDWYGEDEWYRIHFADLTTGVVEIWREFNWEPTYPFDVSDDGNVLVFMTTEALLPEDQNWSNREDIYAYDRALDALHCMTVALDGITPDVFFNVGGGPGASISGDGRFVAFSSSSDGYVPDDDNGKIDAFLRDRWTDRVTRVSVGSHDEQGTNWGFVGLVTRGRCVSGDAKQIAFWSAAEEFAGNDGNSSVDVFLRERCLHDASSSQYGAGHPGEGGNVPTLVARDLPVRGYPLTIDLANSSGLYTVGFVLIGVSRIDVPTALGGSLLVLPLSLIAVPVSPFGGSFSGEVPSAWWSCGLAIDLQALVLDPAASNGVSFSPGLELILGDE